jgi:hypothetical protein
MLRSSGGARSAVTVPGAAAPSLSAPGTTAPLAGAVTLVGTAERAAGAEVVVSAAGVFPVSV